jgi:hypothetical protein
MFPGLKAIALKIIAGGPGLSDLPGRHDPAGCSAQAGCFDHPVGHPDQAAGSVGRLGAVRLGSGSGSRCLLSLSPHEKEMAADVDRSDCNAAKAHGIPERFGALDQYL